MLKLSSFIVMGNKTGKPVFSGLKSTEFSLLENTLVQDHSAIPIPLDFLKAITSDFSKEQELGRGGFGVVYKISLQQCQNHKWVILRHYSFTCSYTAESHGVEWHMRYEIIKGICSGLHYLHTECQIVHLDLKPENILLDDNMEPKISDFGMSRQFGLQQSEIITKIRGGTPGYMAPEYLEKGLISVKADIFSLGVIIIQLMTGSRNYPTCEKTCEQFAVDVVGRWRKRLEETGRYIPLEKYVEQVEACILTGLMCVDTDPDKRPTTLEIIEKLTKVDVPNVDRGPPKSMEDAGGLTGRPNLTTRSFLERFRRTILIGMLKQALKIQDVSQLAQLLAKEVLQELHKIGTNAAGNRSFLERLHASITMATLVQALHSLNLDPSASLSMEVLFLKLDNMRGKRNTRRRPSEDLPLKEGPEQIRWVLEDGARSRLGDEDHMPSVSVQPEDWEALQRPGEVQILSSMQSEVNDRSRISELGSMPAKPKLSKLRGTAPVCVSAVWLAAGIGFLCGLTLGEMRGSRRTIEGDERT